MKQHSIEQLIEIFTGHEKEAKKRRNEDLANFMRQYPGHPVPEYLMDNFFLAEALKVMCEEILRIKNGMDKR